MPDGGGCPEIIRFRLGSFASGRHTWPGAVAIFANAPPSEGNVGETIGIVLLTAPGERIIGPEFGCGLRSR